MNFGVIYNYLASCLSEINFEYCFLTSTALQFEGSSRIATALFKTFDCSMYLDGHSHSKVISFIVVQHQAQRFIVPNEQYTTPIFEWTFRSGLQWLH